jgi:hypothetical protein
MTTDQLQADDLPLWMRPRRRIIDWGLLLSLAFGLLIALPLITGHTALRKNDSELAVFRSLEVARLVRSGLLFSRWAPDLNMMYGSPLFNYLAPLPHYMPGYHQALTEVNPVTSVNLFLALSIMAAGTGMYLFARQRWGAPAGMVAALIYVFSPPIALTLPYFDGDLPLLMALGFLPWALWSIDWLWRAPRSLSLALAAALTSALALSDARIACLGVPVIGVGLASLRSLPGSLPGRKAARPVLIAIPATLMLTAFFWLPALAERDQINWIAGTPDSRAGPIPLMESLGGLPRPAARILNFPVYRGIGIGTWLMALAGTVGIAWRARRKTLPVDALLFLIAGLILLAISTPAFYGLWPSPTNFQAPLPYHALLVSVFCLAAAGAQSACLLDFMAKRWRPVALAALSLVAPLAAVNTLYLPSSRSQPDDLDFMASLQSELSGYHVGTFRDGLLLPESAPQLPTPPPNLVSDLQSGNYGRINRRAYSAESVINLIEHAAQSDRYVFDMTQPSEIEFLTLFYPGWLYSINGQRREIQPSSQGLIKVSIPPTTGELTIWMEGTPIRYLGWAITLAGAGLLLLTAWRLRRSADARAAPTSLLSRGEVSGLALALILVAGLALWTSQRASGATPPTERIPPTPFVRTFSGGIRLLGYDLPSGEAEPGGQVRLSLFWQVTDTVADNRQSQVQIVDADGGQAAGSAHRHPGGIPTSRWLPTDIVRDDFVLALPRDLKPGSYRLEVRIDACDVQSLVACDNAKKTGTPGPDDPRAVIIPPRIVVRSP